ncbi:TetR/AcrR family transcriptional regulator [Pseudonocardia sp. KRD291]|uniref:TetR/AcrR family transcriptional regulator n=1 Tax=Pseudonocardia sp. KRD291 TaxID=2792007 RepID=UPI001C4A5DC3|nr:TetR/AcrR family transcriptional regulator [Pseudonocardia sp. KRD291]MBW0101067.1 TetR/AcrR family transcriptional regulator [Pseudonocardia sp. KRD291]
MARPRDQAARRAQLVEAAAQAVLERGATNARLRDIAEHAGVTPASVLYYYPDVGELLAAVFEQGTRVYILRRRTATDAATGARAKLAACIHAGVPFPGEAESASRLLYELLPVTFRNEAASSQQQDFVAAQQRLYEQVLVAGQDDGTFRLTSSAGFVARSLVALEDGYGIDVLSGAATAHEVERRLLHHATLMTGLKSDTLR